METYSYWSTQPGVISNFNTFMQGGKLKKTKPWTGKLHTPRSNAQGPNKTDWFPTQRVITDGFRPTRRAVMLVDVAGGKVGRTLYTHERH